MNTDNIRAQMRKGILEYCILAVLSRNSCYAVDIINELKKARVIVVEGTLYPLLTRQKNAGLLSYRWQESPQGPPRNITSSPSWDRFISGNLTKYGTSLWNRSTRYVTGNKGSHEKTLDINIAGQLFRVDEDAREVLKHYLDHVSARFKSEQGADETLADIEARIAEIFGGGKEPPTLVSKEMVTNMINIMGAPEDYYDDGPAVKYKKLYVRKSMYDPNSFSARLGRTLSGFFTAFGKLMSAIMRVFAIILGAFFTLFGFLLFFTFVILIFFNNAPFFASVMEPQITNVHGLLSIVLNTNAIWPILILAALVTLLPLAAVIWLGIKLIFRIRESFRVLNIVLFWYGLLRCVHWQLYSAFSFQSIQTGSQWKRG